ncbi:hypothetical protein BC828DRAFT_403322, partial [Blastocladiella britannica]
MVPPPLISIPDPPSSRHGASSTPASPPSVRAPTIASRAASAVATLPSGVRQPSVLLTNRRARTARRNMAGILQREWRRASTKSRFLLFAVMALYLAQLAMAVTALVMAASMPPTSAGGFGALPDDSGTSGPTRPGQRRTNPDGSSASSSGAGTMPMPVSPLMANPDPTASSSLAACPQLAGVNVAIALRALIYFGVAPYLWSTRRWSEVRSEQLSAAMRRHRN